MTVTKFRYMTVDRIEDGVVILTDDRETICRMSADLLGYIPHDGDVLRVEANGEGMIVSAETDTEATEARRAAMREKLRALLR